MFNLSFHLHYTNNLFNFRSLVNALSAVTSQKNVCKELNEEGMKKIKINEIKSKTCPVAE